MATPRGPTTRIPGRSGAAVYGVGVSTDDPGPPPEPEPAADPVDPNSLPLVELHRPEDRGPHRVVRTWWFVVAAALIVLVGGVVGVLVFNSSTPKPGRGAVSPDAAVRQFVAALNTGDEARAAAMSCDAFADQARSAARSGKDPAFRYSLGLVHRDDRSSATATVVEHLQLPGSRQTQTNTVSVLRSQGRWLVCGLSG